MDKIVTFSLLKKWIPFWFRICDFLSFLWDNAFYAKTIAGIEDDVKGDALILQNGLLLNHKF